MYMYKLSHGATAAFFPPIKTQTPATAARRRRCSHHVGQCVMMRAPPSESSLYLNVLSTHVKNMQFCGVLCVCVGS